MSKNANLFFLQVLHCKLSGPGDAFSSASLQTQVSLLEVKLSASVAFGIIGTQKLSRIIKRRPQGSNINMVLMHSALYT